MSAQAKAVRTLYRAKRITIEGVKPAVKDGLITAAEYEIITGEIYEKEG
jgi:hypothetical protein